MERRGQLGNSPGHVRRTYKDIFMSSITDPDEPQAHDACFDGRPAASNRCFSFMVSKTTPVRRPSPQARKPDAPYPRGNPTCIASPQRQGILVIVPRNGNDHLHGLALILAAHAVQPRASGAAPGSKACACCHSRATSSPAGSARARAAAWPAQACIRWTSPERWPASRIAAVRPRCTG